ncbi:hypothetical protein SAMN05216326_12066 [Nitrosomonas marina]|uniref:Uncharacterized protein n=1 Tax=Nitrosomonas marina TaxID=917 RepID=A0A1I0DJS3_9PROT|nr:hypothetical protein [Nitrosomonas marina]SET32717.1 hypothetical protein SAMN05216326_12066 [Nitrosomonas marina]
MRSSINPLQIIFERLCNCGLTNDAFFLKDEVINWPPQIFDTLITYGLLQPTQPDNMLECDGCEESCIMPVTIYPAQNDKPGRAFIICDKRDDIGCVKVNLQRMEQWQVTNEQVANVLCKLLEFNQSAIQKIDNREWRIGTLLGKKRSIPVSLTHDDTLALSFAGHRVPLISILSIKDNILTIDKSALIRLANNPTTDIESESPKARRERLIASTPST